MNDAMKIFCGANQPADAEAARIGAIVLMAITNPEKESAQR